MDTNRNSKPDVTDFNSLFTHLIMGGESTIRFPSKKEYDALRTSLLRRFKNYKPLLLTMDAPDAYIKARAEKQEDGGYHGTFKMELTEAKTNINSKLYEIVSKL